MLKDSVIYVSEHTKLQLHFIIIDKNMGVWITNSTNA